MEEGDGRLEAKRRNNRKDKGHDILFKTHP
jgi:hypothetical protein